MTISPNFTKEHSSSIIPSSLYSLTLSMLSLSHLIFTLLELSSWWYCAICRDDMTITFVLLGLKIKFVSFDHTSTAFRLLSISLDYLPIFFILQLRYIVKSSAYWIHLLPFNILYLRKTMRMKKISNEKNTIAHNCKT